ncbi:MAG: putative excinuclease subunit domain protein [Candidatus Saccharibacteria bacterium]|nr:putative excinuclease subunit domain protein [Candidatus Saccharibacteria bacterium]
MTDALRDKLGTLPAEPGVYFHRDANKKIIYIGKAAVLTNRVMSYFQNGRKDPKTRLLVADIADTEWVTTASEAEALFLESEFIKRYKPKYNIDWKDEKNFIYVKIGTEEFPVVSYVRRPLDDKSRYFGPFTSADALRRAMRMLRKVFPYVTHANWPARGCLQYHLGLCPGPEEKAITAIAYRRSLRQLELFLKGEKTKLMGQIEHDMQRAAKKKDFETAARHRDRLQDLRSFGHQMIFGDREAFDLSRDQALTGLADRLELKGVPRRIEAFDISHLGGTDTVASMVVFSDGVPNRDEYRRFKMHAGGNDDFANMREVITRRFSPKNLEAWPKPDLLLIDGGKGQLASAFSVLDTQGLAVPAVGLAKREEEIIRRRPESRKVDPGHFEDEAWITSNQDFETILLPSSSHVLHLLQRVRDEAHRFAITYQSLLRGKRQTTSLLDDIPGIGPATRKALIRRFGSVRGVKLATQEEVAGAIGPAKATIVKEHLGQTTAPPPADDTAADDMPVQ